MLEMIMTTCGFPLARAPVASPRATNGKIAEETSRLTTFEFDHIGIKRIRSGLRLRVGVIIIATEGTLAVASAVFGKEG